MTEDRATPFGGWSGRVGWGAVSPLSFLSGLVIALVAGSGGWFFSVFGGTPVDLVYVQVVLALALARFALNGAGGEPSGLIFSRAGGSWVEAACVAGRYLLLSAFWIVPLALAATGLRDAAATAVRPDGFDPAILVRLIGVASFVLFGVIFAPPVFLIVAVGARRTADIFRASLWSNLFRGGAPDLWVIYTTYAGANMMAIVLALPAALMVARNGADALVVYVAATAVFLLGMSTVLLGRLAGVYVATRPGGVLAAPEPAVPRPAPAPAPREMPAAAPVAAPPAAASAGAHQPAPARRKALLDGPARAAAARRLAQTDPALALAELERLDAEFIENPHVLHALSLVALAAGDVPRALAAATRAMPLAVQRGCVALAAEVLGALGTHARGLAVERDALFAAAAWAVRQREWNTALLAATLSIARDATDSRAIKLAMQVAGDLLDGGRPADAARIYAFLIGRCSASPLAPLMRDGLARAQRAPAGA